ncbi:UDP-N-acetylglucosamine-dolichyl-phosphate N-acetylglucosaminephosphotransferase [Coccomyxa sp. Obi]|nr:UDP-N-acetylglucosamine-dolichyl-phosphate N-acetylglucosaminephosphotransferase [Coccomyxa sp. Obi]
MVMRAIPPELKRLAVIGYAPVVAAFTFVEDSKTRESIILSAVVSFVGLLLTKALIPVLQPVHLRRNLFGYDINKKGTPGGEKKVPESLGLAPGVVFLICIILFQLLQYYDVPSVVHWLQTLGKEGALKQEPIGDAWLVDYNAALATICFMLFLGFADDVLDIPWRVKLLLPALASLPLVAAYGGGTGISVPLPLRSLGLPPYLELGLIYKVYMVMLVIFCTNAINILAGVNGLEAGQTFVIACAVTFHNIWELAGPAGAHGSATRDGHLFSLYLMLPLAATTLGLLLFNWFPSQVFVGDTYTYFAGMTIAVAGILGHLSETLLLFLIPQVLNFAYSLPQLFKIVPCPRHRLPRFDPATGLLHATPNWNLVNLMLHVFGPCTEERLCLRLLAFQIICCVFGLGVRWALTGIYK